MTTYIALLRAVNVGGTGKLAMADLKALCAALGYRRVETYIASGNVIFDSDVSTRRVKLQLEERLALHAGRPVAALVRSAAELQAVLAGNPFADKEPRLTYAFFLDHRPAADALDDVRGRAGEQIRLGQREIYVHYPSGMGQSKLRIPAASPGTSRNLNTLARLVEMSASR